ncbi:Cyclin asssociated protein [Carpediemonas membranifera]|uniref:Cyclin asssociated protein n=1 Tax=Carpediemonas membranifera TaxID=201153 RepID=A0A8J6BYE8_9EUKA|nr:Cyclin asssociated protein [Carpediemonas membranifera]|eukprot:KAG9394401.1 Cyclin asssociated protein [Carpediemonas membranifera]
MANIPLGHSGAQDPLVSVQFRNTDTVSHIDTPSDSEQARKANELRVFLNELCCRLYEMAPSSPYDVSAIVDHRNLVPNEFSAERAWNLLNPVLGNIRAALDDSVTLYESSPFGRRNSSPPITPPRHNSSLDVPIVIYDNSPFGMPNSSPQITPPRRIVERLTPAKEPDLLDSHDRQARAVINRLTKTELQKIKLSSHMGRVEQTKVARNEVRERLRATAEAKQQKAAQQHEAELEQIKARAETTTARVHTVTQGKTRRRSETESNATLTALLPKHSSSKLRKAMANAMPQLQPLSTPITQEDTSRDRKLSTALSAALGPMDVGPFDPLPATPPAAPVDDAVVAALARAPANSDHGPHVYRLMCRALRVVTAPVAVRAVCAMFAGAGESVGVVARACEHVALVPILSKAVDLYLPPAHRAVGSALRFLAACIDQSPLQAKLLMARLVSRSNIPLLASEAINIGLRDLDDTSGHDLVAVASVLAAILPADPNPTMSHKTVLETIVPSVSISISTVVARTPERYGPVVLTPTETAVVGSLLDILLSAVFFDKESFVSVINRANVAFLDILRHITAVLLASDRVLAHRLTWASTLLVGCIVSRSPLNGVVMTGEVPILSRITSLPANAFLRPDLAEVFIPTLLAAVLGDPGSHVLAVINSKLDLRCLLTYLDTAISTLQQAGLGMLLEGRGTVTGDASIAMIKGIIHDAFPPADSWCYTDHRYLLWHRVAPASWNFLRDKILAFQMSGDE